MILTTVCLAVSASAVKVQVKTEDVLDEIGNWFEGATVDIGDWFDEAFDDAGDWFEGAWEDQRKWWHYEVFDQNKQCESDLYRHKVGELIVEKGYSSTYEWKLKLDTKSDHVNKDFFSVFGLDNGEYRITE